MTTGHDAPDAAEPTRCTWCGDDPLYVAYHDEEWGVPLHDEQTLFELLVLEGAQAGLSWITILRKREGYRRAFDGFDPEKIAAYDEAKIEELLQNPEIVRNRLKVESAVTNARAYLEMREEGLTLRDFFWDFVGGEPVVNHFETQDDLPAQTETSAKMSKELKKRGFRFVGPTICYAHMQSAGMVNDHVVSCFRHAEVQEESR